ncbi:CYTH domain-containing protein [Acinetobacter sp. MB5]|uniref:CYTH domain-containing protein n=1 Tax=Acinetobacter sp. MB5 TaxID=2069438 RepID=UPI000DD05433|nr:CYTH domain-containing protein [Acinetobacter sp. MB5]
MHEIELKLQIPEQKRAALIKAFETKTTRYIDLHARYFDTADSKLAAHHIAIRIRKEGSVWIQTLKGAGENHLQRYEHEVNLGEADQAPELDLSVYEQEPHARQLLKKALGDDLGALTLKFETIVQRAYRIVQLNDSKIEVCLDRGVVQDTDEKREIFEIEFELQQGKVSDLIQLTQQWVKKYHIWIDVRSKAERGNLLAQHLLVSPATTASSAKYDKKAQPEVILKSLIAAGLRHALPNLAAIADQVAESEHYYQAYLALRQLNSSLQLFQDFAPTKLLEHIAHFQQMLKTVHQAYVATTLYPAILLLTEQADPVHLDLSHANHLFTQTGSTLLILDLLAFSLDETETEPQSKVKNSVKKQFKQQIALFNKDLKQFAQLNSGEKCQTLSHIQSWGDALALCTPFTMKKHLALYVQLQPELNESFDLWIAQQYATSYLTSPEQQFFVLGWLANQIPQQQAQLEVTFKKLQKKMDA